MTAVIIHPRCTPIPGQDGWYEVWCGGGVYAVQAETGICTCPHYEYRLANAPGALCRHGRALADYLEERQWCESCGGVGRFRPPFAYRDSHGLPSIQPLRCAACGGSGKKPGDG